MNMFVYLIHVVIESLISYNTQTLDKLLQIHIFTNSLDSGGQELSNTFNILPLFAFRMGHCSSFICHSLRTRHPTGCHDV